MAASANYIRNLRSSVAASVGPVVGYGEPLRPLTLHAPPPATAGREYQREAILCDQPNH